MQKKVKMFLYLHKSLNKILDKVNDRQEHILVRSTFSPRPRIEYMVPGGRLGPHCGLKVSRTLHQRAASVSRLNVMPCTDTTL